MRLFWRFLIAFLAISGAVTLSIGILGLEFGRSNFWDHHSLFFLLFITFFPRLTLFLSSVPSGGILWWLSWLFAPRLLVAVLATFVYWFQNPFLVVMSWLIAFGGESSEKYVMVQRARPYWGKHKGYDSAKWVDSEVK